MPTVVVASEYCKGCGLCLSACPKQIMTLTDALSPQGYHVARLEDEEECTGCCACATVCPDAAIEVYGDARSEGKGR